MIPFEKHLPFFIEKYETYRAENRDFRRYFDLQCLYRLYPYVLMPQYRADLRRVLRQIDFSQQKLSMRLRFRLPRLYNFYLQIK